MSSATESHRLAILTASEIDDLFALPRFTKEDRQLYFDLSPVEQEAAAAFLGERVHLRQIRLISSPSWVMQGRVNIQASHRLR